MYESLFDLTGRTALVTGGSKGIGKAVARGYAEAGADVMICSRHEDELQAAVAEISDQLPVRVEYFVADMTDRPRSNNSPTKRSAAWARSTSCSTTPEAINRRHCWKPPTKSGNGFSN